MGTTRHGGPAHDGRHRKGMPQMRDSEIPDAIAKRRHDVRSAASMPSLGAAAPRRRKLALPLAVGSALVVVVLLVVVVGSALGAASAPTAGSATARSASSEEVGTVLDEEPQLVPMSQAAAFSKTTDDGLHVIAPEAFFETDELALVQDVLAALQADGTEVGFVMEDLETGRSISYNVNRRFYSASSIKVAVCTMIFEENGSGAGYSDAIANALMYSSNDAFSALVNTFGFENFSAWLEAVGAPDAAQDAAEHLYVDISPVEMANVWREVWSYGTSGEEGAEELAGYLSQTEHSPLGQTLRDRYVVWSKPGWYPDDGYDLSASNDAGIVFSDTGDYVLVVLSDIGDDTDALIPLIEALDAAHASMCGDELVEAS